MKLKLIRKVLTEKSTIGELYIDDVFFCNTLEDVDRGLDSSMTLEETKLIKIYSQTCIGYGEYEVVINYSNRFKRLMPLLIHVIGFDGIRIHPGNTAVDTDGCILVGDLDETHNDIILHSRKTFEELFSKLTEASKVEKIMISIERDIVE